MPKWIDPDQQRKNRESHRKGSNKRVSKSYGLGRGEEGEAPSRPSETPARTREGRFPQQGWRRLAVAVRPLRAYTAGTPISPSYRASASADGAQSALDSALCAAAANAGNRKVQCVRIYSDDINAWILAGKLRRLPWCHIVELDLADDYAQLLVEVCYA